MSLKRLVVISGASHMNGDKDLDTTPKPPPVPVHGVNVVLGGVMMSGIVIMVFLICYCCHRNQHKRQTNLPQYWRDPALSMEVYTVEGQQLYEIVEEIPRVNSSPPPEYETVVGTAYEDKEEFDLKGAMGGQYNDDTDLPSYAAALQLARNA